MTRCTISAAAALSNAPSLTPGPSPAAFESDAAGAAGNEPAAPVVSLDRYVSPIVLPTSCFTPSGPALDLREVESAWSVLY